MAPINPQLQAVIRNAMSWGFYPDNQSVGAAILLSEEQMALMEGVSKHVTQQVEEWLSENEGPLNPAETPAEAVSKRDCVDMAVRMGMTTVEEVLAAAQTIETYITTPDTPTNTDDTSEENTP